VNKLFLGLYVRYQILLNSEDGQDLVEYALLVALIALAAVTGVKEVASAVNTSFSKVSTTLA
jgi:pilus assembly protein Flp/PilA